MTQYAVVQWMMATLFELTQLARVKFPPHKPYIVATITVCLVKCEDNGERILYVDGHERSIVKLVSSANDRLHTMQSLLKTEQMVPV